MIDERETAPETTGRGRRGPSRTGRAGLVLLAAFLVVASAVGPARLAAAVGFHSAAAAAPAPGFLPEPTPVVVAAPTLTITNLSSITQNQSIPLAGGGYSPADTTLLRFSTIGLSGLVIAQSNAGPFDLTIRNPGSTATIGGSGESVDLWGVIRQLQVCLSPATLTTLASGLPVVGGLLGSVTRLIGALPNPASSNNGNGCFDIKTLLPILAILINNGIPLPASIPANNLDIDVYALHVSAGSGQTSLLLPNGVLTVIGR